MSINVSGRNAKVKSTSINICVSLDHPLMKLCNSLPWPKLMDIAMEDLKITTTKGFWWLGRTLMLRIHLGIYILQILFNKKDRQIAYDVRDTPVYQIFCGRTIVSSWNIPHFTKIEEFRNRLSPETQRNIANTTTQLAVELGFGDPSKTDIDSTVQSANMSYPSDARLMTKIIEKAVKVVDWLKSNAKSTLPKDFSIDLKGIKSLARGYFFTAKNAAIEIKRKKFAELHAATKKQLYDALEVFEGIDPKKCSLMPWNIRDSFDQVTQLGKRYILDVAHFVREHTLKAGKCISFNLKDVCCIRKGKPDKENEFGRVFQLGRIAGNFLFVAKCTDLRMEDKHNLIPMIQLHEQLFGENVLNSVATDKGYYSQENIKALSKKKSIIEIGVARPENLKSKPTEKEAEVLNRAKDRRAGIEPLIGHVKQGGMLGKSRMKKDKTTLAAGYAAVAAFNLRQIMRYQKMEKVG